MNLRDLRYLVAVDEHRHFGRAAAASFVAQPTLSAQLRKLESELGVTLIERSPRKVMLTLVGREIANLARAILRDVDQLRETARRSHDPETGSLRIGVFPTLGPYLLPHAVPRLHTRFPQLELLLVEEKSDELLTRLRDGRLDAALLALPILDSRLHAEPLFVEPFLLAVPRGHEHAKRTSIRLAELREESLLLLEDGHCLRNQALDVCAGAGAVERAGFRATSLETLRQMVAAGVGTTLLPQLSVSPPVPHWDALSILPFTGSPPSRQIGMLWRLSSPQAALLRHIGREIADVAKLAMDAGPTAVKSAPALLNRKRKRKAQQ